MEEISEVQQVLKLLEEAREIMRNRVSCNYFEDFENLESVINSINNRVCTTSQK
jgi:hypothetical protein